MRRIILACTILSSCLLAISCGSSKSSASQDGVYKGKLEIKALCMNYTIRVTEGNIDTSLVAATWTDESTGKQYQNVFGLGSPCNFPATIEQGDEFYFKIDTTTEQNCAVCMAYYPTPMKKLRIKIIDKK